MRNSLKHKLKAASPYLIIFAIAAILLAPGLIAWNSATIGQEFLDGQRSFYPFRYFVNKSLQAGQLPLWNPLLNCGTPFHAEGEGAIFYPLNLLLSHFSASAALTLSALIHLAGAGCFLFLFLRRIGLGRFAACLGGVVFVLSSDPTSRLFAGHYANLPNLALFPALLWAWEAWRRDRRVIFLTSAAFLYGCLILAGHPQYLFYSSIFLLIYILATSWQEARQGTFRSAFSVAAMFAGALCLGILVGAVQLFPTLDFVKYSFRQEANYNFCSSFSFPPENLITLLFPTFFGNMADGPYWGRWYLWEMWAYVGVFPFALAVYAAFCRGETRASVFRWTVPLFVLLALGGYTPLFRFLFRFVPGFDLFRGNSKFILYASYSLCILAAVGADRLVEPDSSSGKKDRRILSIILGMFAVSGLSAYVFLGRDAGGQGLWSAMIRTVVEKGEWMFSPDRLPGPSALWATASGSLWRTVFLSLAGLAAVLSWRFMEKKRLWRMVIVAALAVPELFLFSREYIVTTPIEAGGVSPAFVEILQREEPGRIISTVNHADILIPTGLETVIGYTSNILGRYNDFLTTGSGFSLETPMISGFVSLSPQILYPNVGYIILYENEQLPPGIALPLARADGTVLLRVRRQVPRTYFSARFAFARNRQDAAGLVASGVHNIVEADLIEAADQKPFEGVAGPEWGDAAAVTDKATTSTTVKTNADGPRLLVLTDAYDKDWVCILDDGENLPIYPVNIAFRGVIVPAGEHVLKFEYRPVAFYVGSAVSAIAILLSLLPIAIQRH